MWDRTEVCTPDMLVQLSTASKVAQGPKRKEGSKGNCKSFTPAAALSKSLVVCRQRDCIAHSELLHGEWGQQGLLPAAGQWQKGCFQWLRSKTGSRDQPSILGVVTSKLCVNKSLRPKFSLPCPSENQAT